VDDSREKLKQALAEVVSIYRRKAWEADTISFRYVPNLPITDEQAAAIAECLGVPVDSKHVADVCAAIYRYHGRCETMTPDEYRDRDIDTLRHLAAALDGLNANVLRHLARCGGGLELSKDPGTMADAAREAIADIEQGRPPSKRGAKKLESCHILLRDLGKTYESVKKGRKGRVCKDSYTGEPTGAYLDFLRAALAPLNDLRGLSPHALRDRVRAAHGGK